MPTDNSLVISINGSAKKFLDELEKIKKKTPELEKALTKTAKVSAAAFAGFAGAIAGVTKAFADYETALVGVGKTTNIQGKELDSFGKEFQKLSADIPLATNSLLGIAQAAGQLGVSGEKNLLKFTKTIAQLGVSTDLSGEQAATQLTRILNVTGEGIDTIDRFGAAIVDLGNNFAATESEIVRVANEVARATAVFGVSASEAAGFGAALRSIGVRAELGGSVVGKSFLKIQKAINEGGDAAKDLSRLTGIAGKDLEQTFKKDATEVFRLFVEGLGNLEGGTAAVFAELEKFGLKGDEVNKVLPVLAKNSDLLARALSRSETGYKNNTALIEEAQKAFATLSSETQKLFNQITTLAVNVGGKLAPTIKEIVVDLKDFVARLNQNSDAVASSIASFLKWGAILTGIVATVSGFALGILKLSALLSALGPVLFTAGGAAAAFWAAATGPVGLAVGAIAAVTAGIIALNQAAGPENLKTLGLDELNRRLDLLLKKQQQLRDTPVRLGGGENEASKLDEQIKKLEELRQAKLRASDDFGTGSLLVRPEAEAGADLSAGAFGIDQEQALPFRAGFNAEGAVEKAEETATKVNQVLSEADQKRLEKIQAENQKLLALEKSKNKDLTEEQQQLATRRAEIEFEEKQARGIQNAELREATLENLRLSNAQEVAEIAKREKEIEQEIAAANARKEELANVFREEQIENADLIAEEDLERLQNKLLTEKEVEQQAATEDAEREIERRNQFLADEQQFGTTVAKLNDFFRKQEVTGLKEGTAQLVQLTRSKNSTLSSIGKAAASVNAAIATAEGSIKAYSALAGIPVVGPALGAAAAGALIAFGVEQQANILGANQGGIVPNLSGSRSGIDSVPALLTPNELVVPAQNFDEVVDATAEARGFENPDDSGTGDTEVKTIRISIEPEGDFIGMIEQKLIETSIQNTGVA